MTIVFELYFNISCTADDAFIGCLNRNNYIVCIRDRVHVYQIIDVRYSISLTESIFTLNINMSLSIMSVKSVSLVVNKVFDIIFSEPYCC